MSSRLVLVVEDDDLLRELIATALEVRGYAVQTASNVVDAKKLFHATDPDGCRDALGTCIVYVHYWISSN